MMGKVLAVFFGLGLVGAILFVLWMRDANIRRLRAEYQRHLAAIPYHPQARAYALAAGRRYYAAHRSFGQNLPQDEHAIANDIRAAGG
jgi:hypothetical protein